VLAVTPVEAVVTAPAIVVADDALCAVLLFCAVCAVRIDVV
jgi:hypothetical protein